MTTSSLTRVGLPTADDGEAPSSSNRKTVLGLAVLAALLLAACAHFVLGADADEGALPPAPAAVAALPSSSAAPAPSPAPSVRFPDGDQVRNGRNPFEVLHAASSTTGSTPVTTVATPATPGLSPAAPVTVSGPTDQRSGGQVRAEVPATEPATARRVLALLRTTGTPEAAEAVFSVEGDEHAVAVGESFGSAGDLLLLSLQQGPETDGWTAVVQVGQGDPFDVVTGAPVALA